MLAWQDAAVQAVFNGALLRPSDQNHRDGDYACSNLMRPGNFLPQVPKGAQLP
jgi:hypothetical protein